MLYKSMQTAPLQAAPAKPSSAPYVGQRMLRVEDPPLLRGRGTFIDDLPVKSGTLHAAILRSPHPHADIVSIDIRARAGAARCARGRDRQGRRRADRSH